MYVNPSPAVYQVVQELLNLLTHRLADQGLTIGDMLIRDAEETAQEVFSACVRHGTLQPHDKNPFLNTFREALLRATENSRELIEEWE